MRQIKEILRQKWEVDRSHREVADSLGVSPGVVGKVMQKSAAAKLDWAQVQEMTEQQLQERLYGARIVAGTARPLPDPGYVHAERRKVGVTLELLHLEYLEQLPEGYHYSQFCEVPLAAAPSRAVAASLASAGEPFLVDAAQRLALARERGTWFRVIGERVVAEIPPGDHFQRGGLRSTQGGGRRSL